MTDTGSAVSPARRLMDEPVTWMRSMTAVGVGVSLWAWALLTRVSTAAAQRLSRAREGLLLRGMVIFLVSLLLVRGGLATGRAGRACARSSCALQSEIRGAGSQ